LEYCAKLISSLHCAWPTWCVLFAHSSGQNPKYNGSKWEGFNHCRSCEARTEI